MEGTTRERTPRPAQRALVAVTLGAASSSAVTDVLGSRVALLISILAGSIAAHAQGELTFSEARKIVAESFNEGARISANRLSFRFASDNCELDLMTTEFVLRRHSFGTIKAAVDAVGPHRCSRIAVGPKVGHVHCPAGQEARCESVHRALTFLQQRARRLSGAGDASTEAGFAETAARYRGADPKPSFPEGARRFKVQAEAAVRDKEFEDAADYYGEGLRIAPWWPEGRFNRALILGELKEYAGAMAEMKKYLALVPDAPNARAAQDKIYEWEALGMRK